MALICDTGVLYSAMDRRDRDHARCARLLSSSREPLVVPAPVVVELEWLTTSRGLESSFDAFLADVAEGIRVKVICLEPDDYSRIRELVAQYSDLPLGMVDASVVALAERLGEPRVASLDHRHLAVVRSRGSYLTLLPAGEA